MINATTSKIINLSDDVATGDMIPSHPNRVLQLDTDGAVYHVANPAVSLERNFKGLINYIHNIADTCKCTTINTHTTMYLKGGRNEMAYYQTYQKARNSNMPEDQKRRVIELRRALHNYVTPIITPRPQWYVEADDSLTVAHNQRIAETGDDDCSIIATGDKDLSMNGGWIYCMNEKKYSKQGFWSGMWQDNFGVTESVRPTGKQAKLKGRGTSMFWAQMLAGDKADHIAGVPKVYDSHIDYYDPLTSNKPRKYGTAKACGVAFAARVISHYKHDKAAYNAVASVYKRHFAKDWKFFLFENAFLLWMRRTHNPLDVLDFLRPLGFDYELHSYQQKALDTWVAKCHEFNKQNGIVQ